MIKVNVQYYGMLAELTGIEREEISIAPKTTLEDIHEQLKHQYGKLEERTYKIAINNELNVSSSVQLQPGDQLSFLPPFAGG